MCACIILFILLFLQPLFNTKVGVKALLGVSTMVHNYCTTHTNCEETNEITNIIKAFEKYLGVGCRATSDEEKSTMLLALKALGNAGVFVNAKSILERCYTEDNDMEVRVAAIEAWRRTPATYSRDNLLAAFQDRSQDNEIRIAAYLAAMVHPTKQIIYAVKESLISEGVNQVASFVWTHLTNLQESAFPEKQAVRELIGEELLQNKFTPEVLKFSRNYESSFAFTEPEFAGMVESNVIFSSNSFLPRSAMINFNVDAFGKTIDLLEIGGRMEGFESYIEKFFSKDGYFPEETVENILKTLRQQKQEEETMLENYLTKSSNNPDGSLYMKIFGNEVSYKHFHSLMELIPEINFHNPMELLIKLLSKEKIDFTKNINIIDSTFKYPTVSGLPLFLNLNSAATVGLKLDGNFVYNGLTDFDVQGLIHPSVAVNVEGTMGIDSFVAKNGVQMSSSMHASARLGGKAVVKGTQVIDFEVNLPKDKDINFEYNEDYVYIKNNHKVPKETPQETIMCNDLWTIKYCNVKTSQNVYKGGYNNEPYTIKYYVEKTEGYSPVKFSFKNEVDAVSMLINLPKASQEVGFSFNYDKTKHEFKANVMHPMLNLNHYANGKFNIFGDNKEMSVSVGKDTTELYGAKITYDRDNFGKNIVVDMTSPIGVLFHFDANYKLNTEAGDFSMGVAVETFNMPSQTLTSEYWEKFN